MVEAKTLPRCYSLRKVAEQLCVSVKTVRRLIYNEEIKAF
jgi:transposase